MLYYSCRTHREVVSIDSRSLRSGHSYIAMLLLYNSLGIFLNGVSALMSDGSFRIPSAPASQAYRVRKGLTSGSVTRYRTSSTNDLPVVKYVELYSTNVNSLNCVYITCILLQSVSCLHHTKTNKSSVVPAL